MPLSLWAPAAPDPTRHNLVGCSALRPRGGNRGPRDNYIIDVTAGAANLAQLFQARHHYA